MRWTYHRPTVFNTKQKFSILTYSIQYQPKVFITKAWHNIRAVFMRWTYQPTVGGRGLQGCRYNSLPFSSLCSPTGRLRLLSHQEPIPTLYLLSSSFYSFLFLLLPRSPPQKILGLALPGSRTLFTSLHTCCDLQSSLTSSSSLSSPNDLYNHHDDLLHHHY